MPTITWGALPEEWRTFSELGLIEDLLPVVSNPNATISPASKLQSIGKTPSRYNAQGHASGLKDWTQRKTTPEDIIEWSRQPDYGICLQTRHVRALDIDVTDATLAHRIAEVIKRHLGSLPERYRSNSTKSLFAFRLEGDFTKRIIKTQQGIIEFLATGQQFVACGTHPSGVKYEWSGNPLIPTINATSFEALWAQLESEFAIEPATSSTASVKAEKLAVTSANDPVAVFLHENGYVLEVDRATGRLDITCPFEDEHSGEGAPSATSYFPAMTGGYALGHFDCKHAHCIQRTDDEFKDKLGIYPANVDDFADLDKSPEVKPSAAEEQSELFVKPEVDKRMFTAIPADEFSQRPSPGWIVKNVLPRADIAVVFGQPGCGKSFAVLDISAAIASGSSWRELKTKHSRVVYIAAEGAGGFRNRLVAYSDYTATDLSCFDLSIISAAPNLMDKAQALEIAKAVIAVGKVSVVVVDTFAQIMPGGNENSGEDVGKVLAHCHGINRATGALVVLVHHSGKDEAKGARGHSSLKGNADTELEVYRVGQDRVLTVSKQKDGEDGKEYGFRLVQTGLGIDKDGDGITSCVVVATENTPKRQKPRRGASVPHAEGGEELNGTSPSEGL